MIGLALKIAPSFAFVEMIMRVAIVFLTTIMLLGPGMLVAADSVITVSKGITIGVEVVFTGEEVQIILAHYKSANVHKHKGKAKQKRLPPGIAKNLARGKPLPPGIAKQSLPYDLLQALPPVRDGHERVIVAGKILLIEIATQIVHDVLTDVLFD